MNTSLPPVVATQNSDIVLLLALPFLITQLKRKSEPARMERIGNGLLAVRGRKSHPSLGS